MNILLVEDDDGMCTLIERLMRGMEATIRRAEDWTQMTRILDLEPVDVILLDLGLPDSSTPTTLSRIRNLKMQHPQTAVCVVTGNTHVTEQQAREAGADDYLHKDSLMGSRTLVQIVASLVNRFGKGPCKLDTQIGLLKEATRQTIEDMNEPEKD